MAEVQTLCSLLWYETWCLSWLPSDHLPMAALSTPPFPLQIPQIMDGITKESRYLVYEGDDKVQLPRDVGME
eukprot:4878052-Amphidinium_carterae.2